MKKIDLQCYYVPEEIGRYGTKEAFHVLYKRTEFLLLYNSPTSIKYVDWYEDDESAVLLPVVTTEEGYFQNSLLWDYKIDINVVKYIQNNIEEHLPKDDEGAVVITIEY